MGLPWEVTIFNIVIIDIVVVTIFNRSSFGSMVVHQQPSYRDIWLKPAVAGKPVVKGSCTVIDLDFFTLYRPCPREMSTQYCSEVMVRPLLSDGMTAGSARSHR